MQIPADPLDAAALAAALTPGQEVPFRQRLLIDWDQDGTWDHALSDFSATGPVVRLQQELNDSSPISAATSSGASAAQLEVAMTGSLLIGGEYIPVSELFAPYNTASPLYLMPIAETPIRWYVDTWTTRGWIATILFTGWIEERSVQLSPNKVELTAINIPPKLRDPVFWPPWAVDGPAAARAFNYAPQRGLASSVVDYICNAAGLRTRPRPPWESSPGTAIALAWLPLCGSFAPSAGRMFAIAPWGNFTFFPEKYPISSARYPQDEYWTDGPFGQARNAFAGKHPGSQIYTGRDQQPAWAGHSTAISAWIHCGPTAVGYDPNPSSSIRPAVCQVYIGAGTVSGSFYAERLSIASNGAVLQVQAEVGTNRFYFGNYTPGTDAWRHVHVRLDHSIASPTVAMFVDGVQQVGFTATGTTNSVAATPIGPLFFPTRGIRVSAGVRISDVMAWQEAGSPTVTPERTVVGTAHGGITAVVGRSLNEISYLPRPGDSGWDVIKAIAAAEYAAVYIQEDGTFHFYNRENARWSDDQNTLTLSVPSDVGTKDTQEGRANSAEISAQPGEASWQNSWSSPSVDAVIGWPGTTEWVFATDDDVIAVESGTVPRLYQSATSASSVPVWSGSVDSGYVFVFDATETEELVNQSMVDNTDQAGFGDRQFIRLRISNTDTQGRSGRFRLKNDPTAGTDPQPALRIGGLVLARSAVENSVVGLDENIAADGQVRTVPLTGGDWRQHLPSVERSALYALRTASQPLVTFDRFQTVGDPRRQLSDPFVLLLGTTGQRVVGFASGVSRTFDDRGFRDDLVIRAGHAPGRWALGDPVLGVLESTAILG